MGYKVGTRIIRDIIEDTVTSQQLKVAPLDLHEEGAALGVLGGTTSECGVYFEQLITRLVYRVL